MTNQAITGSEALAYGALEAGVQFATGYPGSPSTATMDALLRLGAQQARVEWAINEKSAFDAAFGASLAGVPSLICLKSVGLNVALDSLMVSNLAGSNGGLVLLVGDDPGGWGSQNEEDSRPLVAAAEVPLLEPTSPAEARNVMVEAFDLSRRFCLPAVVRITRALSVDQVSLSPPLRPAPSRQPASFQRRPERYNVLPIDVVKFHQQLQTTLGQIQTQFEISPSNGEQGTGRKGVIASGYAYHKLLDILSDEIPPELRLLGLTHLHPLPSNRISSFLRQLDAALVIEETQPYVETRVQAIAQRAALTLPIYGRSSGHLPGAGELAPAHLALALTSLLPDALPSHLLKQAGRCPAGSHSAAIVPTSPFLMAYLSVMERHGGRDAFVVTGETGCMVRSQLPPYELLDVKYGMGSSIGLAAGLCRTDITQKVIALTGDSAFLHSGLGQLIDAAQAGIQLLVILLANQTTSLSGGQPHPATGYDAQGRTREPIDLATLVRAVGPDLVRVVDPEDTQGTEAAIEEGLLASGLSVVISSAPALTGSRSMPSGYHWRNARPGLAALIPILVLVSMMAGACGSATPAAPAENDASEHARTESLGPVSLGEAEKLQVVATTNIVADVVASVGGDRIELDTLMDIGVDPHSYVPTPAHTAAIHDAHVVFANGAGLEDSLEEMFDSAGGDAVQVHVSHGLEHMVAQGSEDEAGHDHEHGHGEGEVDPHVWFDVQNIIHWVSQIEEALSSLDPDNAEYYAENAQAYVQELEDLDAWVQEQVATIPQANRKLVTSHPSFGYLSERYGLEQVGAVYPISPSSEPSAQDIAALEDAIRAFDVPAVFTESTINPKLAAQVAADTGVHLVSLYTGSLGTEGSGAETYILMMRYDVAAIVDALK